MYCPMCGKETTEVTEYCECGFNLKYASGQSETAKIKSNKLPIIIIAVAALICAVGVFYFLGSGGSQNKYVRMVKEAESSEYPGVTYGEAFDEFFSNPKWKSFEATSGERVVQFEGKCYYNDTKVKVKIQFILDLDEGRFSASAMKINDVDQPIIMIAAMIKKAFSEY